MNLGDVWESNQSPKTSEKLSQHRKMNKETIPVSKDLYRQDASIYSIFNTFLYGCPQMSLNHNQAFRETGREAGREAGQAERQSEQTGQEGKRAGGQVGEAGREVGKVGQAGGQAGKQAEKQAGHAGKWAGRESGQTEKAG